MSGQGSPARTAAVEQRIAALGVLGEAHDQAAVDFRHDLPRGTEAYSAGTATTDAVAAVGKTLEVGVSRQLDRGYLGKHVTRFAVARDGLAAHKFEGLGAASVLVVVQQLLAHDEVFAEETHARIAVPGLLEGHHVGKRPSRIQEAARQ